MKKVVTVVLIFVLALSLGGIVAFAEKPVEAAVSTARTMDGSVITRIWAVRLGTAVYPITAVITEQAWTCQGMFPKGRL